ncbi:MAG: isoleucine--tRNA ligase [Candidatus Aenigmatarchaeota archaeon]
MNTVYDAKKVELEVQQFWKKHGVVEKIVDFEKNATSMKKFYLLDGPPYANAKPHAGHVKTTVFKDVWGKFKFMQGHAVWWQPGFDCGGLPIENKVEKELNVKGKDNIEKIGVAKFNAECDKFSKSHVTDWMGIYKKIAAWRGWLEPYMTSDNSYLESGWWTVKQLYDKGLVVEGERPGFWCPKCETVLSGYEASDSYTNVEDPSILIKFPVKGKKNEYFIVWTTTPWTLPGNVAVAAHPDEEYVKVQVGVERYILANARLEILTDLGIGYKILKKFKGSELDGMKYEPLLNIPTQKELVKNENALRVFMSVPLVKKRVASKILTKKGTTEEETVGHIVDMETGSGLVHIAPGHGDVDNKLGKHYHMPELSPVDEKGRLTEETGEFAGKFVKDADSLIIDYLRKKGLLLQSTKITHSYPLCWRCKSPLIYRMSKQWFLIVQELKKGMQKFNKQVNWLPEFARERMRIQIDESPDWAVTRQRYWGIPMPLWICKKCGAKKVIGSMDELRKHANRKLPNDVDLHKHVVDKIQLRCHACDSDMYRVPDIMTVWFDSGIAPWASLGYPFKNKTLFEKLKPVDLIDESLDQIRGWFYSLMVCSTATFGEMPFKTVCLNGWTLDDKGEKMSKSLGNVVSAETAYNDLGTDALRLYICHEQPPWETQKFSVQRAKELGRSLNILWNTYAYFKTYSKICKKSNELRIEDHWLLSRLNSLVKKSTDDIESFRFQEASRSLIDFVTNEFSRIYIKLVRSRKDSGVDYTMSETFSKLLPLLAPFTPFIAEAVHKEMFNSSVHLSSWPCADDKLIRADLEKDMLAADELISAANAVRQEKQIKLRWPLKLIETDVKFENEEIAEIVKSLANVNDVVFVKELKNGKEFSHGRFVLDETVDENEAVLRELLRAIQAKRKEKGLEVADKIMLAIDDKELKQYSDKIKEHVGAAEIKFSSIDVATGEAAYEKRKIKFFFEKV